MSEINQIPKRHPLHIGMRTIKTAVAAMICAFLYFLLDRNPTFACIGAIFGMGSHWYHFAGYIIPAGELARGHSARRRHVMHYFV